VPTLTVAENPLLNAQPTGGFGWIRWGAMRRQAERVLAGWGMELNVQQECERLSVEQRQIVEIARALIQGALHHPRRAHGGTRGAGRCADCLSAYLICNQPASHSSTSRTTWKPFLRIFGTVVGGPVLFTRDHS
jgi:hypothetical protein